ncbi:MAG: alcohol dehydrogenase catalytic domain-containing protein [Desulfitobacterium hafniense]|nr:alcohol dehydrogenase catalytic domain-containing protein [Desulfitobacterium hafniense]
MSRTFELYVENPHELKLREIESAAAPKDHEVKVKVIYGGICGSDIKVYKGKIGYAKYPLRPGHEVLGIIVEAGVGTPYKAGTKVTIFPNTFCGQCEFCLNGKINICTNKKPLGVSTDGLFGQEVVIDSKYVIPVPDNVPDERAVLTEPLAVVVHAIKKVNISCGTKVAIIGCGTEGLLAGAIVLSKGADLTAIDVNSTKLELAKRLGNVQAKLPNEVKDQRFDLVIEAAGVKASLEQALEIVKPGGTVLAIGINADPVDLNPIHLVRSEISILGSIIYTLEDFTDALQYLNDHSLNIEPIVSKIYSYSEFPKAFEDANSGNYAKIILKF